MEGRDGGRPVDPVSGEQRRPSRADSLRLTRMPQIPRATPIPGQGGGPAGPPAPAQRVPNPEGVRSKRPAQRRHLWIAAGTALLLAVPIALLGADRLRDRAPASAAPPPVESAPEPAVSTPLASIPVIPEPVATAPSSPASAPASSSATAPASSAPAPKPGVTGRANPSGANLALQGTATASASEGDPWQPANAIDGDPSTRWSSGFSDPQWIRVDLGRNWQISEVVLVWEHAYGTAYRVETSIDGKTWKRVFATTTGTGGTVGISEKTVARYLRMYGTKRVSSYGYSLLELQIR
ncbi:F5/8 type C domain-containing protein [Actinoplanes philippinensis]|uniref:F5/8 type C domain-containing protein n=1 Tax=Actinoplanes philippinensis TaxID=35752 RepID=A0A1I2MFH3_9ACTN|nr:discoidin domain-containing protein [Actinoplanes philippinensis]SFF90222.1 F5/8 type C domain-containing protein [Actinoplanes philippinensis]